MGWHVALLGTGGWSHVHLRALAASPHVERVTLVGRNRQARDTLADEFPIVTAKAADHQAVLDDPSVDLVHICLPHHLHADVSCQALSAGKHVICEKPAATNLADFDRIVRASKEHGKRFLVVMNQLYNPLAHRVRALIDAGTLGRPFLFVETGFSQHDHFYRDEKAWRTRIKEAGGGVLIDGGYHMIYKQLFALAGQERPKWITAEAAQLNVDPTGQHVEDIGEDFVSYTIGFDSPLRINSSHAWTLASDVERPRRGFIAGSEATLEFPTSDTDPLAIRRSGEVELVDGAAGPRNGPDTTHTCLLDYLDALANDRDVEHATTAVARETLAVILAAYESAECQHRVTL